LENEGNQGNQQGNQLREKILESYAPIVKGLAEMLGPDCEVLLHDLSKPKRSIIMIENGYISGRKIGDPIKGLVLNVLRSREFKGDRLINYAFTTEEGKKLKSSIMLIFGDHHEPIGALCINMDLTNFLMAKKTLEDLCFTIEINDYVNQEQEVDTNVKDVLWHIIKATVDDARKPVSMLSREERVSLVGFLDQKGVFLVKGAVDMVASTLKVSRFTVYNYLDEYRSTPSNNSENPLE